MKHVLDLKKGWLLHNSLLNEWYVILGEYDGIHKGWVVLKISRGQTTLKVWAKDPQDLWVEECGVTMTDCERGKQSGHDYSYLIIKGFMIYEAGRGKIGQVSHHLRFGDRNERKRQSGSCKCA